jgi:hypothetical protein
MEDYKISATEARKLLGMSQPLLQYHIEQGNIKPLGKFAGAYVLDRRQVENFKRERDRR